MAQYTSGSVSVTNGSNTVTGNGTTFTGNVVAGNSFKVKGDPVLYTIASVVSATSLTLTANYSGVTATGQQYQIARDFTPNYKFEEINVGDDQDWPIHLTQGTIRKIDTTLASIQRHTAVNANATDLASVIALTNQLKAALIASGICA